MVSPTCNPELVLGQPPELNFKTMIIIIFIITCFSKIILELNVFYKDILRIKNKKYSFEDMSLMYFIF